MPRIYNPRVSDNEIAKALEENDYQLSKTSRVLGFTRIEYLRDRVMKNPQLARLIEGKEQYMRDIKKTSEKDFIDAIYQAKGNKNTIAKILGLGISAVNHRLRKHPELQEHIFLASEEQKDIAELKLFELIEQGNFDAIKFYLSRQARDRGYGERLEFNSRVDINNNWNLEILGLEELIQLEAIAQKALTE